MVSKYSLENVQFTSPLLLGVVTPGVFNVWSDDGSNALILKEKMITF